MSSFTYQAFDGSNTDRYRSYLALMGEDRQTHSGILVLDSSLPEESYPQETGLDFQPEALLVVADSETDGTAVSNYFYLGAAAKGHQWGMKVYHPYLTNSTRRSWLSDTQILPEVAEFNAFDPDGFTFNVPNPIDTLNVRYLAMAGGGAYDCGTDLSPSAPGSQSITGLGFKPSVVLFASTQLEAIGMTDQWGRIFVGAADDRGNQTAAWTGSKSGDVYVNEVCRQSAIAMVLDANNLTPIPFVTAYHPIIQAEATVDSFDADGFTLDWSEIALGVPRYFCWMAFQRAEVGRWVYHHAGTGATASITTTHKPHGLAFFCNQVAHDQLTEYSPATNGSSIGVGFCDAALNQGHVTFLDVDAPPFRAPQTAATYSARAFGSMPRQAGGLAHDTSDDEGTIIELEGPELAPIVGMNYRWAARRGHRGRMLHRFD